VKKPTPFGKYYLLERINVGGMAEVFRAKAFGVEGFERLVAVKRILPNIAEDKEFIRMFIEEAKLAVQLNHANIAQIFDLGVVDGAYYIALEHVHGRDLRGMFDRCRQLGEPMPVSQACFVVMKLCEGLDYAHNKRDQAGREVHLVHRDVSPQNVLVSFEGEVKIIDFGIAKAAGKGSKTQAGILKGKFGYMSPEQVRGIPIDRRSDVFSCGIVLYELLTGERLFVGESDFSTLEKVRNVEILPPSTYNRRIPDELERIVLKALAKDPEERYQNAIDLHDELQAFVYTAGEFYSRKDLAGWMKKTFGREIEEETAKLESYRQLKAPVEPAPAVSRTATSSKPPAMPSAARRSTQGMAAVGGTKPPPPPSARMSQQMPAISAQSITAPTGKIGKRQADSGNLEWDDDELETQIYDNPEDDPKHPAHQPQGKSKPKSIPLSAPPSTPAPEMAASPAATLTGQGPDLSSLVSTAKGWEPGPVVEQPRSNGSSHPPHFANGSGKGPTPSEPLSPYAAPIPSIPQSRETAAPVRLVSQPEQMFDPMASFGSGMLARKQPKKSKGIVYIAAGGAAVAVIAVVVIISMTGGKKEQPIAAPGSDVPVVVAGDQNTGFDLYVVPGGVTTWRLDGESRTDKLPSRIRGISPGPHQVSIDAPPGFMSQNQPITVEGGKSPKIEIALKPIEGINGDFESTPPGATVSLFIDGKRESLGASPAKAPLDPRKTYQVLFEKPGYVSVNRPIVFTGSLDEKIVVNLDKAGAAVADNTGSAATNPITPVEHPVQHPVTVPNNGGTHPVTHPNNGGDHPINPLPGEHGGDKPSGGGDKPSGGGDKPAGGGDKPAGGGDKPAGGGDKPIGTGTLLVGSKPPCDIFIDGSSTGLHTPAKDIKLPAGKHKVTLVNTEFGIRDTFTVDIKADQPEKAIKDYSDKINK
jgi:eukaryotic-like serine/threonine-protein kinase